ncbi:unnamed protein product, partial [Didymodactylos carnosus]
MADLAADYYETLYAEPIVIRPHPYVDAPKIKWDNDSESIPIVTYPDIIKALRRKKKKKRSRDVHGLSPYLLDRIPRNYWHIFVRMYNYSFATGFMPKKFKDVRIVL